MMRNLVGVLGGMGPEATILLQQRLLATVVAYDDADHIPLLIDMNPQVPTPLNSGFSGGLAAARIAYKCLTMPDAPVNEGCFRGLTLFSPEGTVATAQPPAATGLCSSSLPTVLDTRARGLRPAVPIHLLPPRWRFH